MKRFFKAMFSVLMCQTLMPLEHMEIFVYNLNFYIKMPSEFIKSIFLVKNGFFFFKFDASKIDIFK